MSNKRMTNDERDLLIELWLTRQWTISMLMAKFGVMRESVIDRLVAEGVYTRQRTGRRRKTLTVKTVDPDTGDITLSDGEWIPAWPGRWKVGDIFINGM